MVSYQLANKSMRALGVRPQYREQLIASVKNPYSHYEDMNKCIFVHIPKAAGKAVSRALFGAPDGTGHAKITAYQRVEGKYNSYYKFTFVRNPHDRLVSAFFYMKSYNVGSNAREFFDRYIGQEATFKEFVMSFDDIKKKELYFKWQHLKPQIEFIVDRKGNIAVDYIGKVESIAQCVSHIASIIGVEPKLEKVNASKHEHYSTYYDDEMKELVAQVYENDFKVLGYEFF